MTIHQTPTAKRKQGPNNVYQAGVRGTSVFTYVFNSAYTTATDIIELGLLPAGAQVVEANYIAEGLGANTADIGIMDGEPGDAGDDTRALTADLLFDGVSVNDTEDAAALSTCLGVAPDLNHRAIGATINADVAAGAAKKLIVHVDYVFNP